jgi:hypothetical protein
MLFSNRYLLSFFVAHHLVTSLFIFLHRQNSDLPNLKVSDLERTVNGALKFHDRVSELIE